MRSQTKYVIAGATIILALLGMAYAMFGQDKPKGKATGITLYGCKTATVYMSVKAGRILSPMWADKTMLINVANPMLCNYKGRVTFYVLPTQDYEIEITTKPEAQ
jgi:hypothetical protein